MPITIQKRAGDEITVLKKVSACEAYERLGGEKVLSFETVLSPVWEDLLDEGAYEAGFEDDWYDIVSVQKKLQNGSYTIHCNCEHVSYRLSDETVNYFTMTDTPKNILTAMLNGTEFSTGIIEPTEIVTFSLQESTTRRGLLLSFASAFHQDLFFSGFHVDLLLHRGCMEPKKLFTRNLLSLGKTVNHTKDSASYTCSLYAPSGITLGDEVILQHKRLGIDTNLRVLGLKRRPFVSKEVDCEIGDPLADLEDDFARIATDMVAKNKNYFGVRISADNGLEVKRSDGLSEAVFNSDTFEMSSLINGTMTPAIYFDALLRKYRISGDVDIEGSLASDAVVTDALYAEQGDVSQLTVDRVETSRRVSKYLTKDRSDDNYIRIEGQAIAFVTATPSDETEQLCNRYGLPLYWQKDISHATLQNGFPYIEEERVLITTEETSHPVMTYVYTELIKQQFSFIYDENASNYLPVSVYGSGTGAYDRGKAYIRKTVENFAITYHTAKGSICGAYFNDDGFVDWNGRRADICVDTANQCFVVTPEGSLASPYKIAYTETDDGMRMTWPDGKSFTVEVV